MNSWRIGFGSNPRARCVQSLPQVLRVAVLLGSLALAGSASATFHLWKIAQIYSNADGSVQFITFTNANNFEDQLAGHTLICSNGAGTNVFTFPNRLPSTITANKTFMIGTFNLATEGTTNLLGQTNLVQVPGAVAPDYIFTNAGPFLLPGTGTINYADVDIMSYIRLPTDGVHSLTRPASGTIFSSPATNAPCNFQGQSNSIVPVRISSIQAGGGNVVLSFATAAGPNGAPGATYAVEYSESLCPSAWLPLTNLGGSTNITVLGVQDNVSGANQRFYRLRAH